MPWTTDCLRIAIHHLAKGLHAGSQTKQLEARRNLRQGLKLQRSRRNRSRCSKLVHGVAFLCGITTPSLAAQGEQRRFSYFNIERDNSGVYARLRGPWMGVIALKDALCAGMSGVLPRVMVRHRACAHSGKG